MKNLLTGMNFQLKAALISLMLTATLFGAFGQGGSVYHPDVDYSAYDALEIPTLTVYGDVFGTDIKKDKVRITLYQLDQSDCDWQMIQDEHNNEFMYALDRNEEYQVWFDDGVKIKILYIDPGYQGNYVYRIDANFTNFSCARMVPSDDNKSFVVHYLPMEQLKALIYKQQ